MTTSARIKISRVQNGLLHDDLPLALGIIGFGNIGRRHYCAATAGIYWEVKAVADPCLAAEELNHSTQALEHWETLLSESGIEAVSICVPHHLHYSVTMAALEAGKHVLVEKPLGLNVEEGHLLIECADYYHRTIMVELTHRFYPTIREVQAFIQAGHLGEIFAVEDRIIEFVGSQIKPWLREKKLAGGGVALTNGIHMLDRIAAITSQKLTFISGTASYSAKLGDIEDTATMLLRLDNGAPVQVLAAWPQGNKAMDDELTIYGEKGTLRVWAWHGWRFEPANNAPATGKHCYSPTEDVGARIQVGVAGALKEFAYAIREDRQPCPSVQDALAAQTLIEQFYEYTA